MSLATKVIVNNARIGGAYYADTAAHAAGTNREWGAFYCVTDTVFSAVTGNVANLTGVTFPAGTLIEGIFLTFTLTSGSVIAYYAS